MGFTQGFLGNRAAVALALLEAHPPDHWLFSDAFPLTNRSSIICSVLNRSNFC